MPQALGIACSLVGFVAALLIGFWIRRERAAFRNDVEDLHLSAEELLEKYKGRPTRGDP
jgi:hypothetical protein